MGVEWGQSYFLDFQIKKGKMEMKRLIALVLAVLMVFPLVACGSEEKAEKYCWNCGEDVSKKASFCEHCGSDVNNVGADDKVNTEGKDLRNYNDFIATFQDLVSKVPDYTILQLSDVPLEDGTTCHVFYINDTLLDDKYRVRVDTDKDSKITWVYLTNERRVKLKYG